MSQTWWKWKSGPLLCSGILWASIILHIVLFQAMRAERDKQIAEGKLKGDSKYLTPRIDSF